MRGGRQVGAVAVVLGALWTAMAAPVARADDGRGDPDVEAPVTQTPQVLVADVSAGVAVGPVAGSGAAGPPADLVLLPPAGSVAVTFDDGPHPTFTPQILDILDQYDAKATFFVSGERVEQYPTLVASIVARGHSVQNHSYHHLLLTEEDDATVREEIRTTTEAMEAAGVPAPRCLRPPYGGFDERIRQLARTEGGLELRTWHIDSEDWTLPGATEIRERVSDVESGQIVLLHDGLDGSNQTVAALPGILQDLAERNLSTEPICWDWDDFGFFDVRRQHQFHTEISWLSELGITGGYADNTFRPSAVVTRQAMAAFLHRMMGSPALPPGSPMFDDLPPSSPFYVAVRWLASAGIADGYPDGTFGTSRSVSRQAMAAFLWRLVGEPPVPVDAPTFSDVGSSGPFAEAIRWLASVDVTTGYPDGTYRPTAPVTRQGMAAFLQRFHDEMPGETLG